MEKSEKREALLDCAQRLFEVQGFHGTGVDQIAKDSGVTKRTLYKHFGSKEGLIQAVLELHHSEMMANMRAQLFSGEGDVTARLMQCFELYRDWFGQAHFSGCIFIKTMNEFTACSPLLRGIAQHSKSEVRQMIYEIALEGGLSDPALLADQLQLLLEGSIVVAQCGEGAKVIDTARPIAERLIREML